MQHVPVGRAWDMDRQLMLTLNGSWGAGWDTFWWLMTQPWFWIPLFVATIWLMHRKFGTSGMLWALAFIVVGLALADQTANFFKTHTPKFRPSRTPLPWGEQGVPFNTLIHIVRGHIGGNFGTVSGHAATAMAIGLTAAGIYRRWWFTLAIAVYVAFTSYSRIYLGLHFPLDILFGLTAGTLIALFMLWLWRYMSRKHPERIRPKQPKTP